MSISSQATQQNFPFSYDAVFDGLTEVITKVGFKLKSADKVIGRISASTGMSLFSYGENLTLVIENRLSQNSKSFYINNLEGVNFLFS